MFIFLNRTKKFLPRSLNHCLYKLITHDQAISPPRPCNFHWVPRIIHSIELQPRNPQLQAVILVQVKKCKNSMCDLRGKIQAKIDALEEPWMHHNKSHVQSTSAFYFLRWLGNEEGCNRLTWTFCKITLQLCILYSTIVFTILYTCMYILCMHALLLCRGSCKTTTH